ncbi:MAG: KH domain-containing protein [Caldisericia bacterium]|jgi:predicted RNA-binding protein YlqC (UPF0109 family)|nr:KH domain-containing protein [Caldisericia bacterium]
MFKDTLMYIVKQLVDKTDMVSINELVGEQNLTYEIKVDPTDLGKVIGKQGRTINALRVLIRAVSNKHGKKAEVNVIEAK